VVTGCVLEGSNRWSGNNSGFTVKVPSAYFKAILQKSTSTAVGRNGWRAAGWYLPHDASIAGGSYIDYVLSVDDLEKKLGYDLFVNLPSAVGAKLADEIEADCTWAK
jgi:DNA/RNA endonuclease G (NUC1)